MSAPRRSTRQVLVGRQLQERGSAANPIAARPSPPNSAAEPLARVKVPSRSPGGSTLTRAKNLLHEETATDGSDGKGLSPNPLHLEYESGGHLFIA